MASKPTYWVSIQAWMGLTFEQHRRLDSYCRDMGYELGIDLIGDRANAALQVELQKDTDEGTADMTLGGRQYRERR